MSGLVLYAQGIFKSDLHLCLILTLHNIVNVLNATEMYN